MALRYPLTATVGGTSRVGLCLVDTRWKPRPQATASFLSATNGNPRGHGAVVLSRFVGASLRQYGSKAVVRVPAMAESITEGQLSRFSKQVGDFIGQDEELATIETDKIDISVNAAQAGIVERILASEGDTVTVDQEIAEIQTGKQSASAGEESSSSSSSTQKTMQEPPPSPVQEAEPPQPTPQANSAAESSESTRNPDQSTSLTLHPPSDLDPRPCRTEEKVRFCSRWACSSVDSGRPDSQRYRL